jgi:hypothetical protein
MILRTSGLVAGLQAMVLLAGSWVLPAGCASQGARFEADLLPRIERGVTTRAEIRAWFGRPVSELLHVFVPPLDVAYTNTVRHELEVFFDDEGRVEDYVYEREEIPSRRVY